MPEFFVPSADTPEKAEELYEKIKSFGGCGGSGPRIFRLEFRHDGNNHVAQVGEKDTELDETVFAIFDCGGAYHVCTTNRGVLRGSPALVGKHDTHRVVEFD
jgi:hypothetical protein